MRKGLQGVEESLLRFKLSVSTLAPHSVVVSVDVLTQTGVAGQRSQRFANVV